MLAIENLSFEFEDKILFKNIKFYVLKGQVLELTASNGKGKTTLLKIIAGLKQSTSGSILWKEINNIGITLKEVNSQNILSDKNNKNKISKDYKHNLFDQNYKNKLLYIGHKPVLHPNLSIIENLKFVCGLTAKSITEEKIIEALKIFSLHDVGNIYCKDLSKGQVQKANLARLILEQKSIWLLDEPFASLDQDGIKIVTDMVENHIKNNGLAIIATHIPVSINNKISFSL